MDNIKFGSLKLSESFGVNPQVLSPDATQPHMSLLGGAPVSPAAPTLVYPQTVQQGQDIDPTLDFSDLVNQLLERVTGDLDSPQSSPTHLSVSELKLLGRSIEDISKQGILEELPIDTISSLLKYLESSMCQFTLVDPVTLNDGEKFEGDRDGVKSVLDQVSLLLEHIALSLVIFEGSRLPLQLFPEELLIDALIVFKSYLDKFLLPSLELSKDTAGPPNGLELFRAMAQDDYIKSRILALVGTTCEISENLRSACRLELSDQIIVKLVYIALSLFFIDGSSEIMLGQTESESMRQTGSNLLRKIYSRHPNQRSWILEEILSLLIKLPHGKKVSKGYRLIDGTKIHSSSALLMQLVHTGSESPIAVTAPLDFCEACQSTQKISMKKLLDVVKIIQEEAKASVVYVFNFLLSRCTKGTKSSLEADYRTVLDSLLSDLLVVLGQPEWPSAELYLLLISKTMIRYLDDPKAESASKSMAVDILGLVAAKVKTVLNQLSEDSSGDSSASQDRRHPCYGVVGIETKPADLLHLRASYNSVVEYLGYNEVNDLAAKAAKNMWIYQWIYTICIALEGGAVTLRAKSLKALSMIVTGDYAVLAQQNVRNTIALRLQDQSPSVRDAATDLVGRYMLQDTTIRKAYYEIVSDRISDTGLNVRKRVIRLLRDMYHKVDSPGIRLNIFQKLLLRVNDEEAAVKDLAIRSVSEVWFGPFIQATNLSVGDREGFQDAPLTLVSITSTQKRDVSKHARTLVDMVGKLSPQQDEALRSVVQHLLTRERGYGAFDPSAQGQELTRSCTVLVNCLVDLVQTLQDEDAPKSAVASTVHTLHIFVKSEPRLVEAKHLSALLVYLHCSSTSDDWRVTMFVLRIFQDTVPVVRGVSTNDSQMAEKLVLALIAKCPVVLLPEATSALCLIVNVLTVQYGRLCKFFQTCMDLLIVDTEKLRGGVTIQENKTRRLMTIVGLLCRHFSFEQAIKNNPKQAHLAELKLKMPPTVQEYVFNILAPLCEPSSSKSLQQTAVQSIGHIYMSSPALMNSQKSLDIMDSIFASRDTELKSELLQIYSSLMVKIQATPAIEQGKDTSYSLIAKVEDHIDAGIGSAVMQRYLDRVLQCVLVVDRRLQAAAVEVVAQVTQQALVHPMLCMPAIVALETSEDPLVSGKVFKIHRDLHQKHASLIYARSMECIRTMYIYQKTVHKTAAEVRGFKISADTGDVVSLLAPMYSLVGDKRQARNSLLSVLVKVLDIDLTAPEVEVDGYYSRFIAEMLACLEYRTMEEVFLIIFLLNRIIAGSGMTTLQNIAEMSTAQINSVKDQVPKKNATRRRGGNIAGKPAPRLKAKKGERKIEHMPAQAHLATDNSFSEDVVDAAQIGKDMPFQGSSSETRDDREPAIPLNVIVKACVVVEAAIELKNHLKRVYDISETKCQQFQPTAHASHKEKPVPRFTGVLARIQWKSSEHELKAICSKPDVIQEDAITRSQIQKQLERFQQMIEMETVERLRDESHMKHAPESSPYPGHTNKAGQTSDDTDGNEDDDN
ncbi:Sister chromatid cohesion protein 2 [Mortierella sp. AD094]|nr:Sister chromatid cohesion protein 2 [Mortierella sp. AD094]